MAVAGQRHGRVCFGTFELDRSPASSSSAVCDFDCKKSLFNCFSSFWNIPERSCHVRTCRGDCGQTVPYVDFDKSLNTAVKKVRYALGDSPDKPVFIDTVPRRGYRFIAPISGDGFRPEEPRAGEPIVPTPTEKKESSHSRSGSDFHRSIQPISIWKYWYLLIAVLFGTAAVVLVRYGIFARPPALELQNTEITELTDNGKVREMAIAPDGLSLAYARTEGLEQSLWLKRIDSGNETQLLTADTVNFAGIEFSPDGHFLYFVRSEKSNPVFGYLYRIRAEGGGVEQLIRDADTPVSFSPDATQLVYTRGYPRRQIFEVRVSNVDGTSDHLLATVAGNEVFDSGPTWSPKNDSIAVSAHLTGERRRFALYLISLSTATQTELYGSAGAIGRPLWIKGGRELIVTLEDLNSHRGQLWTVSTSSGEAHRLTNDLTDYSSAVDLISDGKRLAVIANSAVSNLWIAGARDDLSHPSQVTSGEPTLYQVRELSDGRLVAIGTGAWSTNMDGTDRVPVRFLNHPEWIEPCGRFLLVVTSTTAREF